MKLDEVSTGSSTLRFADYIQHMRELGVSAKVIGEIHSVGVNCLKAGAIFENSDDDDIRMSFKHGYVQLPLKVESKEFFRPRIGLYMNHADDPVNLDAAAILNLGYKPFTVTDAAKFNFAQFFTDLDQAFELVLRCRSTLETH